MTGVQKFHSGKLTSYKWAVYKQCWSLTENDRKVLDLLDTRQITVSSFLEKVETNHEYKDFIQLSKSVKYEVCYLHCALGFLEQMEHDRQLADKILLLSFRYSSKHKLAICVCWLPRENEPVLRNLDQFKELV